jgi:elongation factor P
MAYTNGGNVKKGMFILHNGIPHQITAADFVSPGKGSAFTRSKLRNLRTGNVMDFTFKTTEKVEIADIESVEMQYLYFDGSNYAFMNPRTYEQLEVSKELVGEYSQWLKEEMIVYVQLFNEVPMGIFPPKKVTLKVTESEDATAGDRANAPKKPATVETGATVFVPLFVKAGDMIIVDTETGTYVSRANGN